MPTQFLMEIEKLILKCVWKRKASGITMILLRKSNEEDVPYKVWCWDRAGKPPGEGT